MFRPPLWYSALFFSGGPDFWKTCVGQSGTGTAPSLPRSGSSPRVRLCRLQVWGVTALTPGPATSSAGMGWSGWDAYPYCKFRKPKPGCTGAEGASTQACGLLIWTLPQWASVLRARTHACLLGFVAQIFLLTPVTVGKAREWKGPGGHGGSERGRLGEGKPPPGRPRALASCLCDTLRGGADHSAHHWLHRAQGSSGCCGWGRGIMASAWGSRWVCPRSGGPSHLWSWGVETGCLGEKEASGCRWAADWTWSLPGPQLTSGQVLPCPACLSSRDSFLSLSMHSCFCHWSVFPCFVCELIPLSLPCHTSV